MGSIHRRKRDGGIAWDARWRDPEGQQRKRTFTRRVDAERFLVTVSADIVRGDYVDLNDPTTLREYAEDWREAQLHRPTTRAHVETNLRRHVYPYFGDRRLSTIRPSEIQKWVTTLSRTRAPATVQVIHGIVAAIFKAARRDRLVTSSPCDGTRLPKRQPVEVVPLTTETVHALADAVPERYRALVVLGAGTGMRQGECLGLVTDELDLDAATLRVARQLILLPRQEPFFGPPKTPASHRTVPLPEVVVDALRTHLERFPVRHRDGLVFTDDDAGASAAPPSPTRSGDWPSRPPARGAAPDSTTSATTTRRCSSGTASRSRPCSAASGTPPPRRRSTPTPTSGRTPRTAPAPRSTPSSARRRRPS